MKHPALQPYQFDGKSFPQHAIPPVFITSGKHYTANNFKFILEKESGANILPNAGFYKSSNGYTRNKFYHWWIEYHFNRYTRVLADNGRRPRLIVLDGHGSHITLDVSSYSFNEKSTIAKTLIH